VQPNLGIVYKSREDVLAQIEKLKESHDGKINTDIEQRMKNDCKFLFSNQVFLCKKKRRKRKEISGDIDELWGYFEGQFFPETMNTH